MEYLFHVKVNFEMEISHEAIIEAFEKFVGETLSENFKIEKLEIDMPGKTFLLTSPLARDFYSAGMIGSNLERVYRNAIIEQS